MLPFVNDQRWHDNSAVGVDEQLVPFRYRQIWLPPLDPAEAGQEGPSPQRAYAIAFPVLARRYPSLTLPERVVAGGTLAAAYSPDVLVVALWRELGQRASAMDEAGPTNIRDREGSGMNESGPRYAMDLSHERCLSFWRGRTEDTAEDDSVWVLSFSDAGGYAIDGVFARASGALAYIGECVTARSDLITWSWSGDNLRYFSGYLPSSDGLPEQEFRLDHCRIDGNIPKS